MNLIVHTDGGSRGNPGEGAVGVVIELESNNGKRKNRTETITEFGKYIGISTNNEAEYRAVIEALKTIQSKKIKNVPISLYLDSKLVCEQLRGNWKIKKPRLQKLFSKVKELEFQIGSSIMYYYVPREKNKRADFLVNKALNEQEL